MDEEPPTKGREKKIQVIFVVILVLIGVSAAVAYLVLYAPSEGDQGIIEPAYTDFYTGLSPENALAEIEQNYNLVIIDARSCKCNYNKGHLENATWNTTAQVSDFFNTTYDLLVYDNTGSSESIEFCGQMLNNTKNAIFYLEGGYNAWTSAGYPVVK